MKKRLLIVDDEDRVRHILRAQFQLLGYEITEAADGEAAEKAALAHRPDLVLLDVMMPKKNGFAVCRDLKRDPRFNATPVILLTAKDTHDDVCWGLDSGADAYVTKPYDPHHLERLVAQLLQEVEEGRRRVTWTGMRTSWLVEDEFRARREAGGSPLLLELTFPPRELEVFEQKYGHAKLRDVIFQTGWKISQVLREQCPTAVLGQRPDDSFLVIVSPEEEKSVMRRVVLAVEPVLHGFYDTEDIAAGVVTFPSHAPSQMEPVGLLHLCWRGVDLPDEEEKP